MNKYYLFKPLAIQMALFLFLSASAFGQNRIAENLQGKLMDHVNHEVQLLEYNTNKSQDASLLTRFDPHFIQQSEFFNIDQAALSDIKSNNYQVISLMVTVPGYGDLSLSVFQEKVLSEDFVATSNLGDNLTSMVNGILFYRGVVSSIDNSIVSLTMLDDQIAGVISIGPVNYNLGAIKGLEQHIIYKDQDLNKPNTFVCDALEREATDPIPMNIGENKSTVKCVEIRAEVDFDLNNSLGGSVASMNYTTALFNEIVTLYSNDDIDISLSEVFVWVGTSPYSGGDILDQMTNNSPNADLTALLTQQLSGGVAWLGGLCSTTFGNSVNGVDGFFNNVPTYSWDVNVTAHEIGHNLDSDHTHGCAWNGNNTAIDGCGVEAGYSEGCDAPDPPNGGTIMSYCHLTGVGVDFNEGFGPQPTERITNYINSSSCLANCAPEGLSLTLVAFIEGPYDQTTNLMSDNLRTGNYIPLTEPYSAMGFSVPNVTANPVILGTSGINAVVDWVVVEIRSVTDPSIILESQAAFVQRDGDIMAFNGSPTLSFPTVSDPTVYISVRHRNHLGARTADPQSNSGTIDLDFSSPTFNFAGVNAMLLIDGKLFLIAGDANADGQVNNVDKNLIWRPLNGQTFTYPNGAADYNMDGGTNSIDNNLYWRKNNSFSSGL